jgi:hypothetical protein
MRPLTSPVRRVAHRYYRAGEVAGVIGRILLQSLITLALTVIIGLGIMVLLDIIRPEQISDIFKISGRDSNGQEIKISRDNYQVYYQRGVGANSDGL